MYSAVSGLKTHQTKMDVIGNNIANVNTVAFKSSSVTFQDILYQNTSGASGANAQTGVGGINAKQIGLGVSTGATNISITSSGAAETTGRSFDLRLTDSSTTNFFIVNTGSEEVYTRAGSFYVDGAGNLCMTSTGYTVLGWVAAKDGTIQKGDTLTPLQIMSNENLTSAPESTTNGTFSGIIDANDSDINSDTGLIKNLNFYDNLGYSYTARFAIKVIDADAGQFSVSLESILDSNGNALVDKTTGKTYDMDEDTSVGLTKMNSLFGNITSPEQSFRMPSGYSYANNQYTNANTSDYYTISTDGKTMVYHDAQGATDTNKDISCVDFFGIPSGVDATYSGLTYEIDATANDGTVTAKWNDSSYTINFSTDDGTFGSVGTGAGGNSVTLNLKDVLGGNFSNVSIDFTGLRNANNGGMSTATITAGDTDGSTGKGKKLGSMIGLSVDNNGQIYGSYDNGNTVLLGQIAVAQFANASGLEKVGDNTYATTLNSGEAKYVEVQSDGSKITSGELEMSNVDLSTEFTAMITTQRGFQANSRVITTSDTLLEELVNLKR
jgi:flagellar hook protein FlgE